MTIQILPCSFDFWQLQRPPATPISTYMAVHGLAYVKPVRQGKCYEMNVPDSQKFVYGSPSLPTAFVHVCIVHVAIARPSRAL